MGYTCHGCRHGKPCVKEHMKRAANVEAPIGEMKTPVVLPVVKQALGTHGLSDDEVRALHRGPVPPIPGSIGAVGGCHCPVCDPAFHQTTLKAV